MSQVAKVFQLNRQGFNLHRGAVFAVVMGLLIIVGVLQAERRYFLTAIFGALFVAVSDPAEGRRPGAPAGRGRHGRCAADGLGFGIGGGAWGFVVRPPSWPPCWAGWR